MYIPMIWCIDFSKYLATLTILIIYGYKKMEVKISCLLLTIQYQILYLGY